MVLPEASEKARVVEAMFDRIAPDYDRMNRLMTFGLDRGWRTAAVDALAICSGDRVVDLACGTGDLAEEAGRRGAQVLAVDFSAQMLVQAQRRGMPALLIRADGGQLPLADGSCAALVSGFALRNFSYLPVTVSECARVLKPGGRLALLEVDTPENPLLRLGHSIYFRAIVPLMGRLLADRNAYSYLPASVGYLPDANGMRAMLAGAGFVEINKRNFLGGAAQLVTARRQP